MPRSPDPKSKAGFVRSLPSTAIAAEVVAAGKKKGLKLEVNYVYKVRAGGKKKRGAARKTAAVKTGASTSAAPKSSSTKTSGSIEEMIAKIVEEKVNELLKEKLGG